jgi:hypothetical protein
MSSSAATVRESVTGRWLVENVPNGVVTLILLSVLVEHQTVFPVGELFRPFGFHVYWTDAAALAALIVGLAYQPWKRLRASHLIVIGLLFFIVGIGTAAAYFNVGLKTSVVLWRGWLWAVPIVLMSATTGTQSRWRAWKVQILGFAIVDAVFLLMTLALTDFGRISASRASMYGSDSFYGSRPLAAASALILVAAIPIAATEFRRPSMRVAICLFLGIAVAFSQIRAVWFALAVTLAVLTLLALRDGTVRSQWPSVLAASLLPALIVLAPLFQGPQLLPGNGAEVGGGAVGAPTSSSSSVGSLHWRIELWQGLIEGMRTKPLQLVTASLGGHSPVDDDPHPQDPCCRTSAHNQLLQTITMVGLIGVAATAFLWVCSWRSRRRLLGPEAAFLWGLLAFGVWNGWPAWTWIFLGAGSMALVGKPAQSPRLLTHPVVHTQPAPAIAPLLERRS